MNANISFNMQLLKDFEEGDVLALVEIKQECEKLLQQVKEKEVLLGVIARLPEIIETLASVPAIQKRGINILGKIILLVKQYLKSDKTGKKKAMKGIKLYIDKLIDIIEEENQKGREEVGDDKVGGDEQSEQEAEEKKGYSIEDFEHLINDEKLLQQFYNESNEHLDSAQLVLIELEHDSTNAELINTVFRDFHTIKGSSSFLGIKNIEDLSHALEDIFAVIRDGKMILTSELVDVIFYGIGLLRNILDIMQSCKFKPEEIKKTFVNIDISKYIGLLKRILKEYKYKKIGEILQEEGKLSEEELEKILQKQKGTDKKFGQIATEEKVVEEEDLLQALQKQEKLKTKMKKVGFVKVSNEKLNTLIDYVGELVINQSMLKQEIERNQGNVNISERTLSQMEMITKSMKDLVLSMGMIPIEEIFNRLRVVARNTAKELNKTIFLDVHGEETELDRNVIENIYDPLMHIIRNAIDHGIESPEERRAAGKDSVGRIVLTAEHKGSGIEITVTDDGRGIDIKKVLEKAIDLQLVKREEAQNLTKKDILNFLFLPGFSTSSKVTAVSGRGVGLDVVKKGVDQIHGRIEIQTEARKFTKFIIKLPLTLAIIEGFVTIVGDNKYVFPFNAIDEIAVLDKSNLQRTENSKETMIYHRDMHIPVIFAEDVFKEVSGKKDNDELLSLIFSFDQFKYCVVVNGIIGKQEIVVKKLGTMFHDYQYFSGGTIFGDGSIGFVVDLQGFIETVKKGG